MPKAVGLAMTQLRVPLAPTGLVFSIPPATREAMTMPVLIDITTFGRAFRFGCFREGGSSVNTHGVAAATRDVMAVAAGVIMAAVAGGYWMSLALP
jgi:hypothetical protein